MLESFALGDRFLVRSEGGLGLGQTLAPARAELSDGGDTDGSRASEFVVRVPRACLTPGQGDVESETEGADVAPAVEPEAEPETRTSKPSASREGSVGGLVLIIEDNVDTARGLARFLRFKGREVAVAHDGPSGIEAARSRRPRFILLDIGLPGMDGLEVARQLSGDSDLAGCTVIGISGYPEDEYRRRSREWGFDHYLAKPIDHDELLRLLDHPPAAGP
jgi:CheY-like chemotaxis protein